MSLKIPTELQLIAPSNLSPNEILKDTTFGIAYRVIGVGEDGFSLTRISNPFEIERVFWNNTARVKSFTRIGALESSREQKPLWC